MMLMNEHKRQMSAREVIEALFPGLDYGTKVPADVYSQWKWLGGCDVRYLTRREAQEFWNSVKPGPRGMYLRAVAECPRCGCNFAASRINQHFRVHTR